jgi:hypothetical protein
MAHDFNPRLVGADMPYCITACSMNGAAGYACWPSWSLLPVLVTSSMSIFRTSAGRVRTAWLSMPHRRHTASQLLAYGFDLSCRTMSASQT